MSLLVISFIVLLFLPHFLVITIFFISHRFQGSKPNFHIVDEGVCKFYIIKLITLDLRDNIVRK